MPLSPNETPPKQLWLTCIKFPKHCVSYMCLLVVWLVQSMECYVLFDLPRVITLILVLQYLVENFSHLVNFMLCLTLTANQPKMLQASWNGIPTPTVTLSWSSRSATFMITKIAKLICRGNRIEPFHNKCPVIYWQFMPVWILCISCNSCHHILIYLFNLNALFIFLSIFSFLY